MYLGHQVSPYYIQYCNTVQYTILYHSLFGDFVEVVPVYGTDQVRGVSDLLDVGDQGLLLDGVHTLHLHHQRLRLDGTAEQQDEQLLHLIQTVLCWWKWHRRGEEKRGEEKRGEERKMEIGGDVSNGK